jgi:hypothetical protein
MAVRHEFLNTAEKALDLLRSPAVADAWSRPSALEKMSVGTLAAHLSRQVVLVGAVLAGPAPAEPPITLPQHYNQVKWRGADLDEETNASIRTTSEEVASAGFDGIVAETVEALDSLRSSLPESGNRAVFLPWTGWALTIDDLLTTRMLEMVVHSDDLAVSVGVPAPDFEPAVVERVVDLLSRLAIQRHGATAVIRALSRAERAPATIAAI